MSEFQSETQFEFKCYLENHAGELAMNIKQALEFSTKSEYELSGVR